MRRLILLFLTLCPLAVRAERASSFVNTISGEGDNLPPRYVMPLLSNGDISIHFDVQGTQTISSYANGVDGVLWEGRRLSDLGPLLSFGHYLQSVSYGGRQWEKPDTWTQTLDTRNAEMICENGYGDALSVKTEIIVHAAHDIVAIRKTFSALKPLPGPVSFKFRYDLSSRPDSFSLPRRMFFTPRWDAGDRSLDIDYTAYGYLDYNGRISLLADRPVTADESFEGLGLSLDVNPRPGEPVSVTIFLLYSDNLATQDFASEIQTFKQLVRSEGYGGLATLHRKIWDDWWSRAEIDIPDEKLERAYVGGIYELLTNATKWSFPVGIGPWEGRFFAFDETCCYLGLASSNHLDIARRAPEFRKKTLPHAQSRTANTGARYSWQSLEDGKEGARSGYWLDHIFHMSHVATAAWTQYLYTNDLAYLKEVAFPVMKECARFFLLHECVEHPDGSMTIAAVTDLERLGPVKKNPFFTSCGAIYTFESTVKAARILGLEDGLFERFSDAAARLRKTLPNDGEKYIPYPGCKVNSIAVVTGMYPYPVLSTDDPLERKAILHFYDERYTAGNMYAIGSGLCPWYAAWIASALANYGDRDKSLSLLQEAASQIGYFSEHFEINEKDVIRNPWFTTAAGNYVHALDQTLLLNREDDVFVCYSAPVEWKDYSFTLPCYGNLTARVEVRKGRLVRCDISRNTWSDTSACKTFWIPDYLLTPKSIGKAALPLMEKVDGYYKFTVSLSDGETLSLVK